MTEPRQQTGVRPFAGLAGDYSCFRPSYPDQAIEAMMRGLAAPVCTADIGCGTGIGSRLLARRGAVVIGIEIDDDMLAEARRLGAPPGSHIDYREGSAERTGLEEGSLGLVVCAQSFHWFDNEDALREFHRILRPGGRLALMWNKRDETDEFTEAFSRIAESAQMAAQRAGREVPLSRSVELKPSEMFTRIRRLSYPFAQGCDKNQLLGRARSASYFPRSGPLRGVLEENLEKLYEKYQRDGLVRMVYRTLLTLADRR